MSGPSLHEYRFFVYGDSTVGKANFIAFDYITSIESQATAGDTSRPYREGERTHTVSMTNGDRFILTEDQFRALMGAFRQRAIKETREREKKYQPMKNQRQLTIIETPYAPTAHRSLDQNLLYLRDCLRDSWSRGELPFASHAFFPFFLNDSDPNERTSGIQAGYSFWNMMPQDSYGNDLAGHKLPTIVFYLDHGLSPGMERALKRAQIEIGEVGIERRYLSPTTQGRPARLRRAKSKEPSTD